MKLNSKGLTIIELIVSISLISVVMLFLYRLLADVTFEKDNEFFASLNQTQRVEIIDNIEKTIRSNNNIKKIVVNSNNILFQNSSSSTIYKISVESNGKELTFYQNTNTILYRWQMKGGTLSLTPTCKNHDNLYSCNIPIYTTNSNNRISSNVDNNNTIDDLIFTFLLN